MSEPKSRTSTSSTSIVWFRDDLRLGDNPALRAATARGGAVLCLFILENDPRLRPIGGASRWWLHGSLHGLADELGRRGGRLDVFTGKAQDIVPSLVRASKADMLFINRRYDGVGSSIDDALAQTLEPNGCAVESFNGRLLHEPWEVATKGGTPYSVFTPYWKAAMACGHDIHPLPKPAEIEAAPYPPKAPRRTTIDALALRPTKPDWAGGLTATWQPGEQAAARRLARFLKGDLTHYERDRNQLAVAGTSLLSPHLRFGEISPRQIAAALHKTADKTPAARPGRAKFLAEVGWREFDYQALFHHPDIARENLHDQFDAMPWRKTPTSEIDAWRKGLTGYPVVDAGMRELWQTGYMHNRVRMITASFLIKHLLCDWRIGEAWFWDCLCDADPANNAMNWQWVAGSGFDASPFFRIFNPVLQGKRYDPEGTYVRRHVPELKRLPAKVIHEPWRASKAVLAEAGVVLGKDYPRPIVDHEEARARALSAYRAMREKSRPVPSSEAKD